MEFIWVKAHAGICGNEIADRLAKEATQNFHVTHSRIPKSAIKKIPEKKALKMAKPIGGNKERSDYERIFPKRRK